LDVYLNANAYTLLDTVNSFIATRTAGKKVSISTAGIAHFPSAAVKVSLFWQNVGSVFALLMIISLLLPLSNVIKVLVEEKETKMRESMMMMALRSDTLWLSWIMHFMLLFLPLSIILALASRQLFTYSNPMYIFFYFMVFFISSTSYGIFISTMFSKSRTGKNIILFHDFMKL
jgi:ATP-binding cassette, subfamily A (ABC1), member 3